MSEPSQTQANKVLRVLSGRRCKMTATINLPDGKSIEFQCDAYPLVKFNDEDRALWLLQQHEGYNQTPIMRWPEGAILLVEKNPE